jgi:hypothetical protein
MEALNERETYGERAKDKRFITLSEANEADAKNYRKTADNIRAALAKATATEVADA